MSWSFRNYREKKQSPETRLNASLKQMNTSNSFVELYNQYTTNEQGNLENGQDFKNVKKPPLSTEQHIAIASLATLHDKYNLEEKKMDPADIKKLKADIKNLEAEKEKVYNKSSGLKAFFEQKTSQQDLTKSEQTSKKNAMEELKNIEEKIKPLKQELIENEIRTLYDEAYNELFPSDQGQEAKLLPSDQGQEAKLKIITNAYNKISKLEGKEQDLGQNQGWFKSAKNWIKSTVHGAEGPKMLSVGWVGGHLNKTNLINFSARLSAKIKANPSLLTKKISLAKLSQPAREHMLSEVNYRISQSNAVKQEQKQEQEQELVTNIEDMFENDALQGEYAELLNQANQDIIDDAIKTSQGKEVKINERLYQSLKFFEEQINDDEDVDPEDKEIFKENNENTIGFKYVSQRGEKTKDFLKRLHDKCEEKGLENVEVTIGASGFLKEADVLEAYKQSQKPRGPQPEQGNEGNDQSKQRRHHTTFKIRPRKGGEAISLRPKNGENINEFQERVSKSKKIGKADSVLHPIRLMKNRSNNTSQNAISHLILQEAANELNGFKKPGDSKDYSDADAGKVAQKLNNKYPGFIKFIKNNSNDPSVLGGENEAKNDQGKYDSTHLYDLKKGMNAAAKVLTQYDNEQQKEQAKTQDRQVSNIEQRANEISNTAEGVGKATAGDGGNPAGDGGNSGRQFSLTESAISIRSRSRSSSSDSLSP